MTSPKFMKRGLLASLFVLGAAGLYGADPLAAQQREGCGEPGISAAIRVDQGHPWRPPFGLDRVGALPTAHVELTGAHPPTATYELIAYRDSRELERHTLSFSRNPLLYAGHGFTPTPDLSPPFFAHVPLSAIPSELVLQIRCPKASQELVRQPVTWREYEADAVARPQQRIHPVDLGTILPPHDWLLLARGQAATLDVAAISHPHDVPHARVRAWFDRSKPVEVEWALTRGQKITRTLQLPFSAKDDRSTLHVRLSDGARELWKKDIQVMVAAEVTRPAFGAVETQLRYDLPLLAVDPKTGAKRPSVNYRTAWDQKFNDVVVYLPNGSRFVFWRGANYIPFWASQYNTGVLYQWVEDCHGGPIAHPDGSRDCPEPLFDSELRYSRVRIVESSAARVHVRWDYQLTDVRYEVRRGGVVEDFYFYPDGFGTRVVTAPTAPGGVAYLSEFIVMTPPAAYPLEVLPRHMIEALPLEGGKERIELPLKSLTQPIEGSAWPPPKLLEPRNKPMVYRLFAHKDDPAAAIYFHPSDPAVPYAFAPFFDQAQRVTPAYWGNHWPLNRGKWTGWAINDEIAITPGHLSVAFWRPREVSGTGSVNWEVEPLTSGKMLLPDTHGQVRQMNLARFVWLIANADLPDERLRDWGKSFAAPPAIAITGGRLDVPSYSVERRALRVVAEAPLLTLQLKPAERTVNPVFEIDQAPHTLAGVTLDGKTLPAEAYAWDGAVLWIKADIGPAGATVGVRFQ